MDYVVGFTYRDNGDLLLMKKLRPDWQIGLLNGPGGKIEEDEHKTEAIRREFLEEAGVDIEEANWELFCTLQSGGHIVYFFVATKTINTVYQTTDEELVWVDPQNLPDNVISNLRWLVPMSKAKYRVKSIVNEIYYDG